MEIRGSERALGRTPITFRVALGIVLLAWLPYTLYFALDPGGVLGELLGFIPGVLGVGALLAAGFRPEDCFLRGAPLSTQARPYGARGSNPAAHQQCDGDLQEAAG